MQIIIAIIIFGIIVFVHELGHFLAARMSGILVEEFAIGMGPKLFSYKKGDTVYSIRALPIGGFCQMLGEDSGVNDPRSFNNKSIFKRVIVIIAGAMMNFILAIVIFISIAYFFGFSVPVISGFINNSPAEASELEIGDQIISVNNRRIRVNESLSYSIFRSNGNEVEITYRRNGAIYSTNITPMYENGTYQIGIASTLFTGIFNTSTEFERANLFQSISNGFWKIGFFINLTIDGIVGLITATISIDELSGPIGVVSVIGDIYTETIERSILDVVINLANFAALLSVSIGAFNLFPIPALDGGRLIFLIIEAIRRKPITAEVEGKVHFAGFVLLMGLAVFVAFKDITKIFSS